MGKQVSELQKQVNALRNKMAAGSAGTIARFAAIQDDMNRSFAAIQEEMNKSLTAIRQELEAQTTRNSENLDTFMDILTTEQEREHAARAEWEATLEAKFEARFQSIEKKLAS